MLTSSSLRFIGFGLRDTRPPPGWSGPPHVTSVCSVSECVNSAPEGWLDKWRHNDFGFFDTPALALSVTDHPAAFQLYAYRLLDVAFAKGGDGVLGLTGFPAEPPVPGSRVIGYDVVSGSVSVGFECSPLSCNHMADEVSVNEFCLIPDLDAAIHLARRFAAEEPEPGPYVVIEVSAVPHPGA